jgi:hypothetical protein
VVAAEAVEDINKIGIVRDTPVVAPIVEIKAKTEILEANIAGEVLIEDRIIGEADVAEANASKALQR